MMRRFREWLRAWFRRLLPAARPGAHAERHAASYLKKAGYRILARNLRNAAGEIDLVALDPDGRTIVVVEVKSREANSDHKGPRPEVRVNPHKQKQLAALALQMIRRYRLQDRPVRFDVIGIDLVDKGEPVVRHHVNAFESKW